MFGTTLILALREIRRHLLRSFLTILGVVIGVAAVITMVTLGNGATAAVQEQISSLGSNILMVRPGQRRGPDGGESPPPFDDADLQAIREQITGVRAVAGQAQASATAVRNAQNWATTVNGTTNDYLLAQNWELSRGREFTPAEEQAGKSVCIIGATIVDNLFQDGNPVGQRFRLNDVSCEVVGVLKRRGQGGFGNDQDDVVIMPLKTVQRRFTANRDLRSIMLAVDSSYDTETVKNALVGLLRERRNLTERQDDNFNVLDTRQISEAVSGSTKVLTGLLGAVAGVSLIVGGIGIMNIMLVSVTERTREIGIRLAIGALASEVLMQFLVEAVVLACLGGLLGILIALAATLILAPALGVPFIFDPAINVVSFAVSALIGVVFGYFPARRAAALNPIESLRHE
jgi:putative ABC transport system permease protein